MCNPYFNIVLMNFAAGCKESLTLCNRNRRSINNQSDSSVQLKATKELIGKHIVFVWHFKVIIITVINNFTYIVKTNVFFMFLLNPGSQLILAPEVLPAQLVFQALTSVYGRLDRNIHSFLPMSFIMLTLHISQY